MAVPVKGAPPAVVAPAAEPRLRLEFLDGLRGLAALYVVLFHAAYFSMGRPLSPVARFLTQWLHYGHFAVDVFIVLSGFCLMMPVVRAGRGALPHGFRDYIGRRARRILPPYYAAFGLSLALAAISEVAFVATPAGSPFTAGNLLSHLFLVHNMSLDWAYRVNGPLWSVATEWQIYFLFPLILLPVWRRFGNGAAILAGFAIGLAPVYLLPQKANLWWACPWFIGLFALGMAAAAVAFNPSAKRRPWLRWIATWQTAALASAMVVVLERWGLRGRNMWQSDLLVGVGTASLILYCVRVRQASVPLSPVVRALEARWVVGLGAMSYSLYLVHYPVIQGGLRLLQSRGASVEVILAVQLSLTLGLVLSLAYLFHLAFERRFMNLPRPSTHAAVVTGTLRNTATVLRRACDPLLAGIRRQ
jgi:peptidoglycan/LPS O-acetylase OafA/YrhL